ncbi:MAG: mechanosensitive ion channel [Candidatus Omnitrophica bacterium]|nr:mechanosensitive ion channel [Candidatus Omnitrophota bacterium]
MEQIATQMIWGNRIVDYLIAAGILIAGFILLKIIEFVVLRRLKEWASRTATSLDDFLADLIQRIVFPLAFIGLFYFSVSVLTLGPQIKKAVDITGMALLTIFTARFVTIFLTYGFSLYWKRQGSDLVLEKSLNGILRVLKALIWALAVIFFLDNLGFQISAVIAGLGIGGVAVALAAQAILGDLFSYFAILFDRPFEIGDFIIIGDYLGAVEHIGIKTTRIRSLGGEQLVFSNTDLTNSRIRNYKRMEQRRVLFRLGVVYQTPLEKIKEIPGIIKEIIRGVDNTVFDRAHFFSYGDFSLIFEVVYYVIGPDYNTYMDIQEKINLGIFEAFREHGIEFAYPTQTLYMNPVTPPA